MRTRTPIHASLLVLLVGCGDTASELTVPALEPIHALAPEAVHFVAVASGAQEVPARDTQARGAATFHVTDDGLAISYTLIVANIENVVASHIHVAPADQNGPVVAFLYGSVPSGGGRIDGRIAEGTITAADLVGSLAGEPLSALLDVLRSGGAYVNVHTNDGVAPTNTGPGDFPGGEVRGQIRPAGPTG